jgi:hypothetical protein
MIFQTARGFVFGGLATVGMLLGSTAAQAGVLDAHWLASPADGGRAIHEQQGAAQSFTVENTGMLESLALYVGRQQNATQPLDIEIREVHPLGTVLATLSISPALVSTDWYANTFASVDLGAQSFPVNAGMQLTITVRSNTSGWSDDNATYWWYYTNTAPHYTDGAAFYSVPPFDNYWTYDSAPHSFGFQAFVAVPEPGGFLLAMVGVSFLAMRAGLRRRR